MNSMIKLGKIIQFILANIYLLIYTCYIIIILTKYNIDIILWSDYVNGTVSYTRLWWTIY